MDDNKVYTPEVISDTPFPAQSGVVGLDSSQATANQIYKPATIQDQGFPLPLVAHELLSEALNTRTQKILQSFQFTPSGAIQIGNYQTGVSGDVRVSPNGIVARDSAGNTTFALDGDTGDAEFAGIIQSGALVAGLVAVGDNDIVIDGSGKRIIFYNNKIPSIVIGNV